MSEPISIGDLVVVVKACCSKLTESGSAFGTVGTVVGFNTGDSRCPHCNWNAHITWAELDSGHEAYVAWVKRIPPLSELEGEQRDEKLTEPA